jgi:outer membrane protein assembly factor BamB
MNCRMMREAARAAGLLTFVYAAHSADWPQFRGPDGQGHANARALPTEWSPTQNVAWVQQIPGGGWSSPVLRNETVYLTTAVQDSGPASLRALALDAGTGKTLWSAEAFSVTPAPGHKKNSHASPTPVVDGERLYIHFGPYGTAALDFSGKVLWRNTSLKYPPVHGNGGSPILVGDALIFSCDGASNPFIVALNKATGDVLWKTQRNNDATKKFSFSTPLAITVKGQTQVVSPTSGAVMAYDPKDGTEIWRVRYPEGYSVIPRPVFGHGLVFVSSAFDRPVLYAIAPNGKGDITSAVKWSINKGAPNTPSPLLVADEIYFVSDSGIMTCADAKSGTIHWQERVDDKTSANYSASPVFADGKIYVQNEEGIGTVLKVGKTFEVLARNDLKERTLASYAINDGAIYIRTAQHLFRIEQSKR